MSNKRHKGAYSSCTKYVVSDFRLFASDKKDVTVFLDVKHVVQVMLQ
jgi:hypothetical protein